MTEENWDVLRQRLIGFGEQSSRKSYFPELQRKLGELKESEQRFRMLVENSIDVIFVLDEQGVFQFVSPSWEKHFGYPASQVLHNNFEPFVHPDDTQLCFEYLLNIMKSGEASTSPVYRVRHNNGSWRHFVANGSVYVDPSGATRYLGIGRDISEQVKATEDRIQLEKQLLHAQKLDSLGVLAGGLAHDFNNLLTGIMGNLSVALMRSGDNQQISTPLERALQASERAADLTRQLLTFAKGGAPIKQVASLANIIRDSAGFALHGTNVSIEFAIPDDLWPAEVDIGQIGQVVSNLVINADQAMPGGGLLRIAADNLEAAAPSELPVLPTGRYIRIKVIDQGVGIPTEYLDRIFDPYFTTKQQGSGLGLATVHSIITRHGGAIKVDSETGHGAVFTLWLPASDKSLESDVRPEYPFLAGKGKILVMDDEEILRELAQDMLDMLGYECVTCKEGVQACELYSQALQTGKPFSVVIVDLTIPGGMGGLETMKRLLKMDPGVKVIVASGYSSDPVVASYKDYGFAAAVPKPFSIQQMARAIDGILSVSDEGKT
jgi:PAS domain S-box-containing protein